MCVVHGESQSWCDLGEASFALGVPGTGSKPALNLFSGPEDMGEVSGLSWGVWKGCIPHIWYYLKERGYQLSGLQENANYPRIRHVPHLIARLKESHPKFHEDSPKLRHPFLTWLGCLPRANMVGHS